MAHSKNIRWNADGKNGENQSYMIAWRWEVWRTQLVREVKQGLHDECGTYKRNGKTYVRALPNKNTNDNIDK